jgi:quercetin dioxygenase-like cupin family protein
VRVAGPLAAAAIAGTVAAAWAQQAPAFKRTVLQQADISAPGREAVTALVEFQPGGASGRHSHPGEEIGYILDGTFVVEQDGKPPVTLQTGGTFLIPAGTVHNATNMGQGGRVLATYVVEKGKPMATPAPAR